MKVTNKTISTICCAVLAFGLSTAAANDKEPSHPAGKLMKGSQVTGAKLFDDQGNHIGEIKDVLFDENTGGMTHAIVSVGGWLGIGDKESAVPWKFVHQSKSGSPGFVLEIDKAKLKDGESFADSAWPNTDQTWYDKSYSHYGLKTHNGAKLVRASKVISAQLFDQKGDKIGDIKDILMHPNSGRVAYATLDIGKYVGKGDQLTNVPWDLVRQSKKDTAGFVVNADKAKLAGATYFDSNAWPAYDDWGWQTNTYGYYGYQPYWNNATP